MNIIVCIKQVPNTTEIRIDPTNNTLIREQREIWKQSNRDQHGPSAS